MINRLRAMLQDPGRGWDPVPRAHAESYSRHEWAVLDTQTVDRIEAAIGGFEGKRVLDLGGGPGQYSVAFAARGARVTWHDISRNYRSLAQRQAAELAGQIDWSLGYLEDAVRLPPASFDLVFNRICWYYCMNDRAFAKLVWGLVKPGGLAYVDTNNSRFVASRRPRIARAQAWLNEKTWLKVGHPFPPSGRVAGLFAAMSPERMEATFVSPTSEQVLAWKPGRKSPGDNV